MAVQAVQCFQTQEVSHKDIGLCDSNTGYVLNLLTYLAPTPPTSTTLRVTSLLARQYRSLTHSVRASGTRKPESLSTWPPLMPASAPLMSRMSRSHTGFMFTTRTWMVLTGWIKKPPTIAPLIGRQSSGGRSCSCGSLNWLKSTPWSCTTSPGRRPPSHTRWKGSSKTSWGSLHGLLLTAWLERGPGK